MKDEIRLRAAIGAIFLLLVMLPVFLIGAGLRQANDETLSQRLLQAEEDLKKEVRAFQADLVPRSRIEKLARQAERQTGLAAATAERPRFIKGVDPKVFNASTVPDLLNAYRTLAGVEPLYLVAIGADVRNIWSWYAPETHDIQQADKDRIDNILCYFIADTMRIESVDASNLTAGQNFYEIIRLAQGSEEGLTQAYYKVLGSLISDMIFTLPYQGTCYETATRKRGSRKLYSCFRNLKDGEKVYGGYQVTFASRSFPPEKLLADALKLSNDGFSRHFLRHERADEGKIQTGKTSLSVWKRIPAELAGYNSLFEQPASLPAGFLVNHDVTGLYQEAASFSRSLVMAQYAAMLLGLTVAAYFILYGFPSFFRLRLRMLLTISLAVLMPYTILGFLTLRLFERIESLDRFELRSEAESLMFRLHSYYDDQRQQHLLQTLKLKQRLMKIIDLSEDEILNLHAHRIVKRFAGVDLSFLRVDGVSRTFRERHHESISMSNIDKLLAVKFLENLGVLDRDSSSVKKMLEMTAIADGMFDTVRQEYFDHHSMQYEANDTYDPSKVDDFSRMIWFLVPGTGSSANKVRAMATTNVSNLNFIIYNPWEFDQTIFQHFSGRSQHNLIMGHRRHDDTILRWWPDVLNPDSELKGLLDEVVRDHITTGQLTGDRGHYRFLNRRFKGKDAIVYAGISTISPDLVFSLLVRVFPLLQMVFVLLSVMLFADALNALFISPVRGIRLGAVAVAGGDYSQYIQIEKTDEFSQLSEAFNQMTAGLAQREKMRRFVSEKLYDRLAARSGLNELRTVQISRVTMLASDIRGFTTLSEQHDPQQIVSLLNDYFTAMEAAISLYGGVIERFVGDAVMAVFYSGGETPGEERAVLAALEMRRQLVILNRERTEKGLFTVENGVGIATGEAASGMAGSEGGRMVFAVLGQVAKLAERLESETRVVQSKVLICPETALAIAGNPGGTGRFLLSPHESAAGQKSFALVGVSPEVKDD